MGSKRVALILPNLVIIIGIGWLLTARGVFPMVNWIWTLALAAVGVLIIALLGLDQATFVVGPFFIVSSVLSVLRQTGQIELNTEVPILVILLGLLMFFAQILKLPPPTWLEPLPTPPDTAKNPKKHRLGEEPRE
jgi:chromate transport protein ChrA